MAETFTATALQDETLAALCWRVLGRTAHVVEQALELNRDLANQGKLLVEGQVIKLPLTPVSQLPAYEMIQLWD